MYQTTAHQAFQFCLRYARKTEFRRLCELLRNHLQNAAKYSSQMHAINLSDPDTLQRHLDTRFEQLNVAVELELWQEAFKSVEDTHTLLSLSKRPAKNSMMANYFEKLTRIFMVSENYLFHAAAWSRYYNLLRQSAAIVGSGAGQKKDNPTNITDSDLTTAASFVVLSALAIPVISTSRSRGALVDVDEARKTKNTRLTNLLGMSQAPTRSILFKDALSKGLLRRARPEIRELYNILEVEFHPLSICQRISPILGKIGADADMQKYVAPLQQVILTRLFQQLSQVYETVELDFVFGLAQFPEPFEITRSAIEKFIMNGCKKGDLAIRINHATGVLTFDSDVFSSARASQPGSSSGPAEVSSVQRLQSTPAEIVRSQLTRLTKALYITCQYVDPSFNEERRSARKAALDRAAAGAEAEHRDLLARRDVIQKKKESAASAQAAKQREEETQKRLRAQKLQEAEVQRLAEEQKDREARRIKAEQQRVQREEMQKQLKDIQGSGIKGVNLENIDIDELDSARIRAIKLQALEKEKNEISDKLRITAKRLDHLERAYRKEEIKHLPEDYQKQLEADRGAYEKTKAQTLADAKAKHASDVDLKRRLSRLVPAYEQFRRTVTDQRHAEFEKRRKTAERELNNKIEQRKREVRERRERERREAEEAEQQAREEEERIRVEEEQKEREDAERRERLEKEKAERLRQREYVSSTSDHLTFLTLYREADAVAARQREREEEAERRRAERKGQAAAPPARSFERPAEPVAAGGPPRLALAGSKPTWREREAAKAATGGSEETSTPRSSSQAAVPTRAAEAAPSEPAPLKRSGYVPPHLREGTSRPAGEAPPAVQPREGSRVASSGGDRWQGGRPSRPDADRADSSTPPTGGAYRAPVARGGMGEGREGSNSGAGGSSGNAYRPGAFRGKKE